MKELLRNERLLGDHVRARLRKQAQGIQFPGSRETSERSAAVLLLMGMLSTGGGKPAEACLIFNQRSRQVQQPGDLCFPGGGLSPYLDGFLAGLLRLPGLPLNRRVPWRLQNPGRPAIPPGLSRMLATALRESFEEMRINPFRILFLGPMAPEQFQRFNRTIYPMVVWSCGQKHFVTNWEVEKIVVIPLRRFFDPGAYAMIPISRLLRFKGGTDTSSMENFPCLIYENGDTREHLWGLTYRIVMRFLNVVFDFKPPHFATLPKTDK